MSLLLNICGFIAAGFLAALCVTIIVFIWNGKIDLTHLCSEGNGQASMSRFQLLIFTFVVAIGMFEIIEKKNPAEFPIIPESVLTLLGISASTYAVGKAISYSQPQTLVPAGSADSKSAASSAASAATHAAAAQNAAAASQVAATQTAFHAAVAQQAAQQSNSDAVSAQVSAVQATAAQQSTPNVVVVDLQQSSDQGKNT